MTEVRLFCRCLVWAQMCSIEFSAFEQNDFPEFARRTFYRFYNVSQHGQIGRHLVKKIGGRLKGRVKDVRDVAKPGKPGFNFRSIQKSHRDKLSGGLKFRASSRQSDHLPISERGQMMNERPPGDTE